LYSFLTGKLIWILRLLTTTTANWS
jgi:hypothetical protein